MPALTSVWSGGGRAVTTRNCLLLTGPSGTQRAQVYVYGSLVPAGSGDRSAVNLSLTYDSFGSAACTSGLYNPTVEETSAVPAVPLWLTLLLAAIPALAAVVAAIVAGRYAKASKASEVSAQRLRDLEQRISERKYDMYKPIVDLYATIFSKDDAEKARALKQIPKELSKFTTWIGIYGSDEAIRAFHNVMQGSYSSVQPKIAIRLYAEFLIAIRRDIGYRDTLVTGRDLLGLKLNDLYQNGENYSWLLTAPFDEVCAKLGWSPPWLDDGGDPLAVPKG